MTDFKFAKDEGYSDELTARAFGYAFVVFADDKPSAFCVQVFDEEDDEALECGESLESTYGFKSLGEAMAFCEQEAVRLHQYVR